MNRTAVHRAEHRRKKHLNKKQRFKMNMYNGRYRTWMKRLKAIEPTKPPGPRWDTVSPSDLTWYVTSSAAHPRENTGRVRATKKSVTGKRTEAWVEIAGAACCEAVLLLKPTACAD